MVDINRALLLAVKSGKVVIGSKETLDAVRTGRAKMVVIASNCPPDIRSDIEHYAKLSGTPVFVYPGTSYALGEACEKPYRIAAMAIREPGDSDILKLVEGYHGEQD